MKTFRFLLLIALAVSLQLSLTAQTDSVAPAVTSPPQAQIEKDKMNIVKFNLLSTIFLNFNLQYERILKRTLSVTVNGRYQPMSSLNYLNDLYNRFLGSTEDPAIEDAFKGMKISNYAISFELRIYVGEGKGKGFYFAPTYRHSQIKMENLVFIYNNYPLPDESLTFSGDGSANYGGLILGAQWFLGKHFTIDWWFFGPLMGKEKSSVAAVSSRTLTPEEQQELKRKLEDWDMPLTDKTVTVDAHGATMDFDGLMFGYNFGVALGFRF